MEAFGQHDQTHGALFPRQPQAMLCNPLLLAFTLSTPVTLPRHRRLFDPLPNSEWPDQGPHILETAKAQCTEDHFSATEYRHKRLRV